MSVSRKILIIDDDVFLSGIYRVKLEEAGFEVDYAMTGSEAVRLAKTWRPDLVISEASVSGLDGFSLLDEMRKKAHLDLSNIIFIFLTRENLKGILDEADKRGVKICLSKNEHTFTEVVKMIRELLSG